MSSIPETLSPYITGAMLPHEKAEDGEGNVQGVSVRPSVSGKARNPKASSCKR